MVEIRSTRNRRRGTRDSQQFTQDGVYLINDRIPSKEIHIREEGFSLFFNPNIPRAGAAAVATRVLNTFMPHPPANILGEYCRSFWWKATDDAWRRQMSSAALRYRLHFTTSPFTIPYMPVSDVFSDHPFFSRDATYFHFQRKEPRTMYLGVENLSKFRLIH